MRIARWLSVVSLLALVLSACSTTNITADEIMKRVQTARANTKDAHATLDVTMTGSRQDGTFTLETWMAKSSKTDPVGQPISMTHTKVLQSSRAEMQGSEIVNDGTTLWIYSPKQNQVIRGDLAELTSGG
ncbi:MAG: hypothetical protein H0X37_27305, partial [Herpetosiphonaceae bacterium]|nr:hypothetical protein [Herpetosiphonaceae bacterium]